MELRRGRSCLRTQGTDVRAHKRVATANSCSPGILPELDAFYRAFPPDERADLLHGIGGSRHAVEAAEYRATDYASATRRYAFPSRQDTYRSQDFLARADRVPNLSLDQISSAPRRGLQRDGISFTLYFCRKMCNVTKRRIGLGWLCCPIAMTVMGDGRSFMRGIEVAAGRAKPVDARVIQISRRAAK